MKIAVSGKGGVGKTTISAGLAKYFAAKGYVVYAVDADPDLSLGTVLELPDEKITHLKPIVDMRDAMAQVHGGNGAFFSLNPQVDDLLEQYSVRYGNIRFFKMGAVKQGGSSCYCRENSVLNALVSSLLLDKEEVVVLDMGAGIEHLTRGTARGVDLMLVVTEPTKVSIQTARVVQKLAQELGVENVRFIGNKIRNQQERQFVLSNFPEEDVLGLVEFNPAILESAMGVKSEEAEKHLMVLLAAIGEKIQKQLQR